MDEMRLINRVELRGTVSEPPRYSHESRGERFYRFPIETERLSGTRDIVNVVARASLIEGLTLDGGSKLSIRGELRSFNNKSGEGPKLIITVFARELFFEDGDDVNRIILNGILCKQAILRTTPMGREICDIMLAVNRHYGRSDYLPCIAWGLGAKRASEWPVGTAIQLAGRLQSRKYTKNIDGEAVEKTAYEVSITELECE